MKLLMSLSFLLMLLTVTSCGDKDKGGGGGGGSSSSSPFTSSPSTKLGYYNTQTRALEVGSKIYPENPQYAQVMNMAIQNAMMKNLQPQRINGVDKFRVKITGSVNNYSQQYNGGYQPVGGQVETLTITNVEFY